METRSSACLLDCPDLCGLTVTVDQGRVVEVNGDRRGPITDGFICSKVRKIADHEEPAASDQAAGETSSRTAGRARASRT